MQRTLASGAAFLLALGLAGCSGGDPEPKIARTPTDTASSSPISPTASSTPAVALTPEETVRAWVEARNALMASGDDSESRSLTSDSCRS